MVFNMLKSNKFAVTFALGAILLIPSQAFPIDPEVELEIRRVEQQMARIAETNEQLMKDIRLLQRNLEDANKLIDTLSTKTEDTIDTLVEVKNVHISNLRSGQKSLYERLDILDWGDKKEGCKEIGAKHQQVSLVKSADGEKYLKFLCFDGKALHLSTEVSTPLE